MRQSSWRICVYRCLSTALQFVELAAVGSLIELQQQRNNSCTSSSAVSASECTRTWATQRRVAAIRFSMVYLDKGRIIQQRSVWSLKAVSDAFWAIINGILFFWKTLVSPSAVAKCKAQSTSRAHNDRKRGGNKGGSTGGRVTGLSSLRDNSNPPANAGGGC